MSRSGSSPNSCRVTVLILVWVVGLQLVGQSGPPSTGQPGLQVRESTATYSDTSGSRTRPRALVESLKTGQPIAPDTTKAGSSRKGPRTLNRGTAVLLSALLPGAGQFYAGSILEGVLCGTAELTLAGLTIYENRQAGKPDTTYRSYHLDRRNTFLWWTGFAVGFSMADAYVVASMHGFKQEQRLDARVRPLGVELTYRF